MTSFGCFAQAVAKNQWGHLPGGDLTLAFDQNSSHKKCDEKYNGLCTVISYVHHPNLLCRWPCQRICLIQKPNTARKSSEPDDCSHQTAHTLSESPVPLVWFPSCRILFIERPNTASKASDAVASLNHTLQSLALDADVLCYVSF